MKPSPESSKRYDILEAISQIARDKNVSREMVVETIETGLLSAAKKRFGSSDHVVVDIDINTGDITMEAHWKVVEEITDPGMEKTPEDAKRINPKAAVGKTVIEPLRFEDFGRHAIHSAKQSLIQKVREVEREKIYEDYRVRVGEIVTGTVQQVHHGDIFVNLGRAEAILPANQQIKGERFYLGSALHALIIEVRHDIKDPQIVLSRSAPQYLMRLMEIEVPEIYDGFVEIKGIARRAGERSKVAVSSSDTRIDPVGACVGIKGSRIQGIVKELNNERIDIIEYSDDITTYLARSLSPSKVQWVDIDRVNGKLTAVVDNDQLSLAIGKNGINAELASNLTGLSVDIISNSEFIRREAEKTKKAGLLIDLKGIGEKTVYNLSSYGIKTIKDLLKTDIDYLIQIPGLGQKTAEKLLEKAVAYFESRKSAEDEDISETEEVTDTEIEEV